MLSPSILPDAITLTTTVGVVLFPTKTIAPLEGWCWPSWTTLSREEPAAPALQTPRCCRCPETVLPLPKVMSLHPSSSPILLTRKKDTPVANGPNSHLFLCGLNLKGKPRW